MANQCTCRGCGKGHDGSYKHFFCSTSCEWVWRWRVRMGFGRR